MKIDELKVKVEAYRERLKERAQDGGRVRMSEQGPVGMSMIDAIVAVLDDQQRQINELKRS